VPPKNPWAVNTAAVETGSLYIEYVSTRAMGLRGEIVAARYKPASYAISVAIWAIWPTALLIPLSNGRVALAIALALLASLLLNAVLFVILFLVRYPTAASTRKLSYSLQPTGVHGRNPQGTTFKPWSSLRSVQRIEDFLIFDYGATVTAYMPVAAFRDEASADRYMQAVRDLKASNGNFAVIPPGLRAEFATPNPALT
jgi:hypothetical protein